VFQEVGQPFRARLPTAAPERVVPPGLATHDPVDRAGLLGRLQAGVQVFHLLSGAALEPRLEHP